jgi:hypothetical protein
MTQLSSQQQEQIQVWLGYGYLPQPHYELLPLAYDFTPAAIAQMDAVMEELTDIDVKLLASRSDSMAEKVGELQLSYGKHVKHLKSEGCRLLKQLSNLTGLRIAYNKYSGSSRGTSAVNYW